MNKIEFNLPGVFQALYAAQEWCVHNSISYGSLCGDQPVALMYGDYNIAKWKNLTPKEKRTVDGKMTGDMRNGPIFIEMFTRTKP